MKFILIISVIFIQLIQYTIAQSYNQNGAEWTGGCLEEEQSPINLDQNLIQCDNTANMDFQPKSQDVPTTYTIGSTIKATGNFSFLYATNMEGTIVGYESTQIDVRSPSEHQIDGNNLAAEVQITHQVMEGFNRGQNRTVAIVSLLFEIPVEEEEEVDTTTDDNGDDDDDTTTVPQLIAKPTFFNDFKTSASTIVDGATEQPDKFNLKTAFANAGFNVTSEYYMYEGSQTTPDCQENVLWYIYAQPLQITEGQLGSLQSYFEKKLEFANGKGNNREVQDLNSREIKKGNSQCEEQFIYFFTFFVIYSFLNYFIFKML